MLTSYIVDLKLQQTVCLLMIVYMSVLCQCSACKVWLSMCAGGLAHGDLLVTKLAQLIRNAAMTEEYIQHYHEDSESKQQRVRPEEIIRLHETLLQNVTGLLNLKVCAYKGRDLALPPIPNLQPPRKFIEGR